MTAGQDHQYEDMDKQCDQKRQSRANTESLTVGKLSRKEVLAALKSNPIYTGQGQSQAFTKSNTITTAAVVTSDHDHQYEDVDKQHDQTGQGQSQVITKSNTNTTAALMTSDHDHQYEDVDKQGQGQSQAITKSDTITTAALMTSDHDHQYEDVDKQGQGQSQAITKSDTITTAALMTSDHDHQYEDVDKQNQTDRASPRPITKSNTITTANLVTSGHDQQYSSVDTQQDHTDQGQSQAVTESLDARNRSYGTGPTASQPNSLYKCVGQSQAVTESLDARNRSYGTGPTASQPNSLYKCVGQSQAVTESLDARNRSYGTEPTSPQPSRLYDFGSSESQPDSLYKFMGQYQAITKSKIDQPETMGRKLRHLLMFLVIILKEPNMPQADCNALNCAPSPRCSCFSLDLTSIPQDLPRSVHHLYLQFNRISMIRSGAFANLSQLEWLDLSNNRISMIQPEKTESSSSHESASSFHTSVFTGGTISGIVFIGTMLFIIWYNRKTKNPPPGPASGPNSNIALRSTNTTAVEATGSHQYENVNNQHDQTGQGQSLIVGNLSHNAVLAALKPNTMYAGVGTPSKVQTPTSGHDQTGRGQSQASTESTISTTAAVVTSGHDQTGHGQCQAITESTTSTTAAAVTSGHDQIEQGKSQASTESLTSAHDHQYKDEDKTEQGQSQAIAETIDAGNYSHGTGMTGSQPNPLYKSVGKF
uniref:LRRCT domain-containing protein n=1 Tax=Branchiostoma floridae TaxID=7739 RepID=C3ZL13_BRAFL|eukprot:XP_002590684.1 hypothetical protein BRAFLDRAFT_89485 [Branchiostoma floridae]